MGAGLLTLTHRGSVTLAPGGTACLIVQVGLANKQDVSRSRVIRKRDMIPIGGRVLKKTSQR